MGVLVTGGYGFIGSNFIRYYTKKYPATNITLLDKLTYAANPKNLKGIKPKKYSFVKGDICNAKIVEKLVRNCEVIVNFAAESHVDNSIFASKVFTKTNVLGTHTLLEAARKNDVACFLQASTDEVYGSREKGSFKETDLLKPNSPYAASKAAADLLCRAYVKTYGLPVKITRCTNNYGPYQHLEKLIPKFTTHALQNKPLPLYGSGKNVRDWIYVEDHCRALDIVLKKGKVGEIYNIGAGNEVENGLITKMILDSLHKPYSLVKHVEDRKGHDLRYSLNTQKTRTLGWTPKANFKKQLAKTIEWYKKNQWWWNNAKNTF